MPERDQVIRVRVSAEERRMLYELAHVDGVTVSDVVRMLTRRAHAKLMGGTK